MYVSLSGWRDVSIYIDINEGIYQHYEYQYHLPLII
jgi:hypothetical protein